MKQEKQSNKYTVIERRLHLSEYSPEEILEREKLHEQMRQNHNLLEAVKTLNKFCDDDPRQPYYDIKKHAGGKSVFLTIRTQKLPTVLQIKKGRYFPECATTVFERKSKKFFGKTRHDVTVAAAQYVKSGQF